MDGYENQKVIYQIGELLLDSNVYYLVALPSVICGLLDRMPTTYKTLLMENWQVRKALQLLSI